MLRGTTPSSQSISIMKVCSQASSSSAWVMVCQRRAEGDETWPSLNPGQQMCRGCSCGVGSFYRCCCQMAPRALEVLLLQLLQNEKDKDACQRNLNLLQRLLSQTFLLFMHKNSYTLNTTLSLICVFVTVFLTGYKVRKG